MLKEFDKVILQFFCAVTICIVSGNSWIGCHHEYIFASDLIKVKQKYFGFVWALEYEWYVLICLSLNAES